ncbi:hypothetical protein [Domibacillus indicus]|uniref:hypothetical protein n=1 Tax=Domibacillus indicus TaxID=1437523 RepID=UPI000617FF92|nr:hypothetical protein [Domibacillus indicus]
MSLIRNVILVLLTAVLAGCTPLHSGEYRALTGKEKNEFIQANHLNAGAVRDVHNEITVMTFEDEQEEGFYTVSSNSKGEWSTSYFKTPKNKELPVLISGVAAGAPFIVIKINAKDIWENGRHISISWDNGEVQ